MFIQNVAYADIQKGNHLNPGENSLLIQICDPGIDFPVPQYPFKVVKQYNFMDVEADDATYAQHQISNEQAASIAEDLQYALDNKMNVIVHCIAGICRSGAVAEVGVCLGFDDTRTYRQPNLLVKSKLFKCLGRGYE